MHHAPSSVWAFTGNRADRRPIFRKVSIPSRRNAVIIPQLGPNKGHCKKRRRNQGPETVKEIKRRFA
jgi:hypothetical protein